jgi:hypothetical protein
MVSSSHIISRRSEAQVIVNSNYGGSVKKNMEVDSCGLERLRRITRKLSQDCCGNLCENKEGKQFTYNVTLKRICTTTDLVFFFIFMLSWPCIIFSFTLFSFQLDTLTILYIYNLGSFIYLYMFWTDRSIIRRSNAFIAQAASGTVSSVDVCLGRPLVLDWVNWFNLTPTAAQDRQWPRKRCQRLLVQ